MNAVDLVFHKYSNGVYFWRFKKLKKIFTPIFFHQNGRKFDPASMIAEFMRKCPASKGEGKMLDF
jgi:hypothetical protein